MKFFAVVTFVLISLVCTSPVGSETYRIGVGQRYKTVGEIAGSLQPGDTMLIEPGVYREALKLQANGTPEQPIVIRGLGAKRPLFDAENLPVSGRGAVPRAIFQIEGAHLIIEHLEFKNARNGNNGAGIRLNNSTSVVIRDCKISYCDMGIQGGDTETAVIENCEICYNGSPQHNGYSHNFYMLGHRVVVKNCFIHNSLYGQNYKSRAHYNELWYNRILDSNEGEVGTVDGKGDTDRPHSHTLMVGNVVVSKADRTGNRSKYILMGTESGGAHEGTLYLFYNILIAKHPSVHFVQLSDPKARADIRHTVFWGSAFVLDATLDSTIAMGRNNWLPRGAVFPAGFQESYLGDEPGFRDAENDDYRLTSRSPLFRAAEPIEYFDGDGMKQIRVVDQKKLDDVRNFQRSGIGLLEQGESASLK
jgi:hypothetical protein